MVAARPATATGTSQVAPCLNDHTNAQMSTMEMTTMRRAEIAGPPRPETNGLYGIRPWRRVSRTARSGVGG